MMHARRLLFLVALTVATVATGASADKRSVSLHAASIDAACKNGFGVSFVALAVLIDAKAGVYSLDRSLSEWKRNAIVELDKAGLISVRRTGDGAEALVELVPTAAGETIASGLRPPTAK